MQGLPYLYNNAGEDIAESKLALPMLHGPLQPGREHLSQVKL